MRLPVPRLHINLALALVALSATTMAEPLGTGFTYQGQLKSQGAPLDGNVDLRMTLFSVAINGTPRNEVDITNVPVANGLFTVELDFGATAFDGAARWLEVAVRFPHDPTDTEPFTTLAPRQPLTATPYALQTRGFFVNDLGDVGIGTTNPGEKLDVAGRITSGGSIAIDGTGAIGIVNNPVGALSLRTGGFTRVYISDTFGLVGIGTTTPENTRLDVESGITARAFRAVNTANDNSTRTGVQGEAASLYGRGVYGQATGDSGRGVYGYASSTSGTNYGVYGATSSPDGYGGYFKGGRNYFEGKVGIGTDSPNYPLDVQTNATYAVAAQTSASGGRGVFAKTTHPTNVTYGVWGETHSTSGYAIFGWAAALSGDTFGSKFKCDSASGTGVYAYAASNSGTNFGLYAETDSPDGYAGYFDGGRNYFQGRVGIGTTAPQEKLHIAGANANIRLTENGGSPYLEMGDDATVKGYLQWWSPSDRLFLYTSAHAYPIAIGRTDLGGLFVDTETNGSNVGIGTEAPLFKLHVAGTAGKPGGGSWSNSSDRRLKKNIHTLEGSLDRLLQLRGVTFEYKDPKAINELPGARIGMIAQEVEQVFPDWVSEGGHGYKTVTFRGFEALTVEALRELREDHDRKLAELREEKETQLRDLRTRNADLESRVAQLEAIVSKLAGMGSGAD